MKGNSKKLCFSCALFGLRIDGLLIDDL